VVEVVAGVVLGDVRDALDPALRVDAVMLPLSLVERPEQVQICLRSTRKSSRQDSSSRVAYLPLMAQRSWSKASMGPPGLARIRRMR
jgi:hypothetical protein